jgi:hypothetical protein
MYQLFEKVGTPLPKDKNLIDYGFKFDEQNSEKNKMNSEQKEEQVSKYKFFKNIEQQVLNDKSDTKYLKVYNPHLRK